MERNTLVVTDGDRREAATVEETETYYGDTLARVEGETLSGWVEVPN
jgi:hypothetical protein